MNKLGMDYEIVIPEDGEFGRELAFGNWSGLIGMLHRGEADMAVANLGIYENRFRTIDFGFPYFMDSLTFAIMRQSNQRKIFSFLRLFDSSIWMSILISLIISAIVIYFILKARETFINVFVSLFGNILRQPLSFPTDWNRWKLVIGCWFVFAGTISFIYSCTLLAFLALPSEPKTVETFEELSEAVVEGTHRAYSMKGSFFASFLQNSKDKKLQLLGEKIMQNNWLLSAEEMSTDPLKNEYSAAIGSKYIFKFLYGSGEIKSKVFISEDLAFTANAAIGFRKGFCCTSKLSEIVGRLMGSGIYDKFLQEESFKLQLPKSQSETQEERTKALSVKDVADAFILLSIGLLISLFVFFGELIFYHFQKL
ncbi:putative glutamate receptor [Trichonephila inaurata madagascariensis]|uniref:Putative glutamate receptor n=1 Tax=Trichonephila inaurata madagascariensis TaxID=2747483 RepID=A0A8X7C1U5_9ARAC|nr:putative glutamate receptor [Trichonephila inaurata madagascariensis]